MSIEAQQVLNLVVQPTLKLIGLDSPSAQLLVTYTGQMESKYDALKQYGNGPAIGFWQMEPIAYRQNVIYLGNHPELKARILTACFLDFMPPFETIIWNLRFAVCMARIHYWQKPEPLPKPDDLNALGAYWKKYYNTNKGDGTVERFVKVCSGLVTI